MGKNRIYLVFTYSLDKILCTVPLLCFCFCHQWSA